MTNITEAKRAAWEDTVLRLNLNAIMAEREFRLAKTIFMIGVQSGREIEFARLEAMLPDLAAKDAADLATRMSLHTMQLADKVTQAVKK